MQQKRAEGVNAFFTEAVFGMADPNRGGQAGIGLVEALDFAAGKIDERFPDDPELRAVIRDRFGEVYSGIDAAEKGRRNNSRRPLNCTAHWAANWIQGCSRAAAILAIRCI